MFGRVKWFDETKGFGYLISEKVEGEIYAHFTEIQGIGFQTLKGDRKCNLNFARMRKAQKPVISQFFESSFVDLIILALGRLADSKKCASNAYRR